MENQPNYEMTFTNHETFFAIAYRHNETVNYLVDQRNARKVKDDRDIDFHCAKNAEIQRAAMVSIIFSALTLEAFINNYGIERFSRSYFDNHLDKLPAVSKWIVIPRLITGKEIELDTQPFEQLKRLFKRRDRLVHYKTRKKKMSEIYEEDVWVTEEQSAEAVQTVVSIVEELSRIDKTVSTDWLELAKIDPYT